MDMLSYSSLSAALADERERAIREKARDAWRRQQSGRLKLRNANSPTPRTSTASPAWTPSPTRPRAAWSSPSRTAR